MIDSFQGRYRFLSNFWPSPIVMFGRDWATVEHLYQALKTDNFDEQEKIRAAKTPGQAKRLGSKVKLRNNWTSDFKIWHMKLFTQMKFFGYDELGMKLLATGDQPIVEGNTWGDTFWGVCDGKGSNHLGLILMEVREELREEVLDRG